MAERSFVRKDSLFAAVAAAELDAGLPAQNESYRHLRVGKSELDDQG